MHTSPASLFFALLPLVALADPHAHNNARQHKRRTDTVSRLLQPRGFRATFYDVGLGACGKTNVASDFVIAMNVAQYAGGTHCFDPVTISYEGKTAEAEVVDECMGCPLGGIDMSRGLFDYFASETLGEIQVAWSFGGGAPAHTSSSPSPTTSSTPTSTSKPPKPTSTSSSTSSTSSSSSTSSTSRSSSTSTSSPTSTSTTASNTTSVTPAIQTPTALPNNLAGLNALVCALGKLVLAAAP